MMAYNYPYYQQYQQIQPQPSGGFVSARTIEEAYNWPVAPGNSITFKIENQPFVCTKTRGFSPLEQPVFERYRLVKEETPQSAFEGAASGTNYDEQIKLLWNEINALKGQITKGECHAQSADNSQVPTVREKSAAVPHADGVAQ